MRIIPLSNEEDTRQRHIKWQSMRFIRIKSEPLCHTQPKQSTVFNFIYPSNDAKFDEAMVGSLY